jgi:hypothetical protein
VDAVMAAYQTKEQAMVTVMLIYMSGFLFAVASVLLAIIMTVARR